MFSFFRKKTPLPETSEAASPASPLPAESTVSAPVERSGAAQETSARAAPEKEASALASTFTSIKNWFAGALDDTVEAPAPAPVESAPVEVPKPVVTPSPRPEEAFGRTPAVGPTPSPSPSSLPLPSQAPAVAAPSVERPFVAPANVQPPAPRAPAPIPAEAPWVAPAPVRAAPAAASHPPQRQTPTTPIVPPVVAASIAVAIPSPVPLPVPERQPEPERRRWLDKLTAGLRKTGSNIAQVFTGTQIDDALYEELESALLMADAGVKATEYLLDDLKRRVKESRAADPQAVRALLVSALTDLLKPLEAGLVIGEHTPTVIMVVGVNGAGKTTSIGKLTRHLAEHGETVLLAAADTFRAAAKEQLAIWAGRNNVEIVSQEGGDPSAVTFDAVVAGASRGRDVVIADTAGRLPTQTHLMDELKKIKRTIGKAQGGAPHEILLVVDGNTGQNALSQVKSFDEALGLTGLIITKLDGTAKGGVLAAIALWSRERARTSPMHRPVPVYFVGVGEKLEDLETFDAREFSLAVIT